MFSAQDEYPIRGIDVDWRGPFPTAAELVKSALELEPSRPRPSYGAIDWETVKQRNSVRYVYIPAPVGAQPPGHFQGLTPPSGKPQAEEALPFEFGVPRQPPAPGWGSLDRDFFPINWPAIKRADLDRGAYLVYDFCIKPAQQLASLAAILPPDPDMLPVAINVDELVVALGGSTMIRGTDQEKCLPKLEKLHDPKTVRKQLEPVRANVASLASQILKHYGKVPIIYGDYISLLLLLDRRFDQYMIWLSHPSDKAKTPSGSEIKLAGNNPWTLWDYTSNLAVLGLDQTVNGDVFFGTVAQYQEFKDGNTNTALAAALNVSVR